MRMKSSEEIRKEMNSPLYSKENIKSYLSRINDSDDDLICEINHLIGIINEHEETHFEDTAEDYNRYRKNLSISDTVIGVCKKIEESSLDLHLRYEQLNREIKNAKPEGLGDEIKKWRTRCRPIREEINKKKGETISEIIKIYRFREPISLSPKELYDKPYIIPLIENKPKKQERIQRITFDPFRSSLVIIPKALAADTRYDFPSVYEYRILIRILQTLQQQDKEIYTDTEIEIPRSSLISEKKGKHQYYSLIKAVRNLYKRKIRYGDKEVSFVKSTDMKKYDRNIVFFIENNTVRFLSSSPERGCRRCRAETFFSLKTRNLVRFSMLVFSQKGAVTYSVSRLNNIIGTETYISGRLIKRVTEPAKRELDKTDPKNSFTYELKYKRQKITGITITPVKVNKYRNR